MTSPALDRWRARVTAAPRRSLDGWGWLLLRCGAALAVPAFLITPPVVYAALGMAAAGALLCRAPVHRLPGFAWGVAFSAWLVMTVAVGRLQGCDASVGGMGWSWMAWPLCALGLADARARTWSLRLLAGLTVVVAGLAVEQALVIPVGPAWWQVRVGLAPANAVHGLAPHKLALGYTLALALVALAAGRAEPTWLRRAGLVAASLGTLLAAARSALLGLGAAVVVLWAKARWRTMAILALGLLALGGAYIGWAAHTDPGRLRKLLALEDGRQIIWRGAALVVADHPWIGVGGRARYGQAFTEEVQPWAQSHPRPARAGRAHAHNTSLSLAAEHGLPAAVLHLLLLGAIAWYAWQQRAAGSGPRLILATLAAALVAGIFEPFLLQFVPGTGTWIVIGLGVALTCAHRTALAPGVTPPGRPPAP